jgi:hypothetical protein
MDTLNVLPTNKTLVFYSPLEGNNCLVRTGTVNGKISSFFNSVLYACSRSFKNMNTVDTDKLIAKVRDNIFIKINTKCWEINGMESFRDTLKTTMIDFYKFINTNDSVKNTIVKKLSKNLIKSKKDFELFEIITELLPPNIIYDNNDNHKTIVSFKSSIMSTVKSYLENLEILHQIADEKSEMIIEKIVSFIKQILHEVEFTSFSTYKHTTTDVNSTLVEAVSNYFNCNVYFLDSVSRTPYILNDIKNFTYLNSIIIMSIKNSNEEHYEIVGKLTHGNIIKREFLSDDALVLKMKSLLEQQYRDKDRGMKHETVKKFSKYSKESEPETDTDEDPDTDVEEPEIAKDEEPEIAKDEEPEIDRCEEPEIDSDNNKDNVENDIEHDTENTTDLNRDTDEDSKKNSIKYDINGSVPDENINSDVPEKEHAIEPEISTSTSTSTTKNLIQYDEIDKNIDDDTSDDDV